MKEFRRPRWIIFSLFVVSFVVISVVLGFWQLRRLDERRAHNAVIASRLDRPPIDLANIRTERTQSPGFEVPASDFEFTVIEATGTFTDEGRVLVRSQVASGLAGTHGVFSFDLGDGTAVLVNVGWFPLRFDPGPINEIYGDDPITVTGLLRTTQERPQFGQQEGEGVLDQVARIDIARIQEQIPLPLEDFWIQLLEPAVTGRIPIAAKVPTLDEGSHFSYAIQWFSFALIAIVGYAALIRSEIRRIRRRENARTDSPDSRRLEQMASD